MNSFIDIFLIALFTSLSCAVSGNFLLLRRMSMIADAISHTVLLGIVTAFFIAGNLDSPLLIAGAAMTGVFTVWLIETLCRKNLMAPDAAIGIIFPLLFSIAVILITRYASHVHIDADCIIEGELAFAPFDRLVIDGVDYGAKGLYTGGGMFLFTASVIALFYKEFALSSFDPIFAEIAGFSPMTIHYGLMSLVSLVIVTAFHSVGSVLVIAFLIIPAMTASLWTRTLSSRIFLSCFIGAAGALSGIAGAIYGDTSLAGMMAAFLCLFFLISLFLSPSAGFLAAWRRRRKQKHRLLQSIDTGNGRPL